MASLWRAATSLIEKSNGTNAVDDYDGVEFWSNPERTGWLTKQGEYIKTWRRRWFVLKQGKLFWFKDSTVTRASKPRGVIPVTTCLTVKGAEDVLNKQYAFELSTRNETMYFIAESEKEKEDWINSIGRSIVQHSRSVTASEIVDYDNQRLNEHYHRNQGFQEKSIPVLSEHRQGNEFSWKRALLASFFPIPFPMVVKIF